MASAAPGKADACRPFSAAAAVMRLSILIIYVAAVRLSDAGRHFCFCMNIKFLSVRILFDEIAKPGMADGFRRLVEALSGNLESSDRYCRAPKKVYMSYGRLNARVC